MIKLGNIPIRLHPLFILILMLSIWTGYFLELITLFSIIFIHELGHVVAARGYGWKILEIQLLPFGGVAKVDDEGNVPIIEELVVAISGPLQNAWMIIVAIAFQHWGWWDSSWSSYFIEANIIIGLFNLLPILPLDGGKIMRALLSYILPYYVTIRYSHWISLILSVAMILSAFLVPADGVQLNILMIGAFLCYMNGYQSKNVFFLFIRFLVGRDRRWSEQDISKLKHVPIFIDSQDSLQESIKQLKKGKIHHIFILNEDGSVHKMIPENKLLKIFFREHSLHINNN